MTRIKLLHVSAPLGAIHRETTRKRNINPTRQYLSITTESTQFIGKIFNSRYCIKPATCVLFQIVIFHEETLTAEITS